MHDSPIHVIPRIARLRLRNVGPIEYAGLPFDKGVNLIVGESGTGKSTIVRALLWAVGAIDQRPGGPLDGHPEGLIEALLATHAMRRRLPAHPGGDGDAGADTIGRLRAALASAWMDGAVVFDSEVLGELDADARRAALGTLAAADCQVIAVLHPHFPAEVPEGARVITVKRTPRGTSTAFPAPRRRLRGRARGNPASDDGGTHAAALRIIRKREGERHPLATGQRGMWEFAQLPAMADRVSVDELRVWLAGIDRLIERSQWCFPCCGKLAAFGELICGDRLPVEAAEYRGRAMRRADIAARHPRSPGRRDYRAEVREAVDRWPDAPKHWSERSASRGEETRGEED